MKRTELYISLDIQAYFESHGVVIEWTKETLGKSYEVESPA